VGTHRSRSSWFIDALETVLSEGVVMVDEQGTQASGRADRAASYGVASIRRVVVGVDGSEGAQRALDWAGAEAERDGATLCIAGARLYNDLSGETPIEQAMKRVLEEASDRVAARRPKLDIKHQLYKGLGAEALIDASRGADLLVVGSRGYGGFRSLLLGSVGQHCLTHAPCSVVIVRHSGGEGSDEAWTSPRRIVVGVDGSAASTEALRWATVEAHRCGAELHILGSAILPGPSDYLLVAAAFPEAAREAVGDALHEVGKLTNELVVHGAITEEPPAPALVEASRQADLVVLGSRGLGAFRGLLLGSVSQHVAQHAYCSVAVVRDQVSG
jgi:nucleotide-binding universal stress UspA family protein